MQSYIHGENILKPIAKLPKGKKSEHNIFIVGHSETGHNHVLEAPKGTTFNVVEDMARQVFLEVKEDSKLVHKKSFDIHETEVIKPGIYQVIHAIEYNPFTKQLQRIWD